MAKENAEKAKRSEKFLYFGKIYCGTLDNLRLPVL